MTLVFLCCDHNKNRRMTFFLCVLLVYSLVGILPLRGDLWHYNYCLHGEEARKVHNAAGRVRGRLWTLDQTVYPRPDEELVSMWTFRCQRWGQIKSCWRTLTQNHNYSELSSKCKTKRLKQTWTEAPELVTIHTHTQTHTSPSITRKRNSETQKQNKLYFPSQHYLKQNFLSVFPNKWYEDMETF